MFSGLGVLMVQCFEEGKIFVNLACERWTGYNIHGLLLELN